MAWIVGIDEAGYGPNLGPFVMTAVACRLPDDQAGECLWQQLAPSVRRAGRGKDDRLVIDDSKAVYTGARGLAGLERGVFAFLADWPANLGELVEKVCPDGGELRRESWYTGATAVPAMAPLEELRFHRERLRTRCAEQGVSDWLVRSFIVCPRQFNTAIDRANSKSVVLSEGLMQLLEWVERRTRSADDSTPDPACNERLHVFGDKQGGRNTYTHLIRQALLPGRLTVVEETSERSCYEGQCGFRPLQLTFQARADSAYFLVALASMVSKYLRELCMDEFNRFWLQHVPDLKPTAGYPGDAPRFFEAIWPVAQRLEIPLEAIWRKR